MNSKTGFPPFREVPEVDKFNKEAESNIKIKSLCFLATVIPRQSDNSFDWKVLNFKDYCLTILKPLLESAKFKPIFATQTNYQELGRRIEQEINPQLVSICSGFASLSSVKPLNELVNNYLGKYFQGLVYAETIHDELGKQLGITNHQKYTSQQTGNSSENAGWSIALNEFAFKK